MSMLTKEIIEQKNEWDVRQKFDYVKYASRFVGKNGLTMIEFLTKPFPQYYPKHLRSFEFRIKLLKLFPVDNNFWKPIIKKSIEQMVSDSIVEWQNYDPNYTSPIEQLKLILTFVQKDEIPKKIAMNFFEVKSSAVWTQLDLLDEYINWFGGYWYDKFPNHLPPLGRIFHYNPKYTMACLCEKLGIEVSQIADKNWHYGNCVHA